MGTIARRVLPLMLPFGVGLAACSAERTWTDSPYEQTSISKRSGEACLIATVSLADSPERLQAWRDEPELLTKVKIHVQGEKTTLVFEGPDCDCNALPDPVQSKLPTPSDEAVEIVQRLCPAARPNA